MNKTATEVIFATEFYFKYAIVPGHIPCPPLSLVDVKLGEPCFVCGRRDFEKGVSAKKAIAPTFTDFGYCHKQGDHVCEYCASTITNVGRKVGKYCISRNGVLMKTGLDIADVIKNPPEPPFLCAIGDGQKHTVYRGRVTVSKEMIFIYDLDSDRLIEINRKEAMEVADTLEHLAKALKSKPYAVARGNFGKTKIGNLSDDDRKLFEQFTSRHGFYSEATWAALKLTRK